MPAFFSDNVRLATIGNAAVQVIGGFGHLLFIPIYLHAWGAETYGFWLICVGFASYAAILDFGVSQAASTEAIKSISNKNIAEGVSWLQVSFYLALSLSVTVFLVGWVLADSALSLLKNHLGADEVSHVFYYLLILQISALLIFNSFAATTRAVGGNATVSCLIAVVIFLEVSVPPLIALFGGSVEDSVLGLFFPRFIGSVVLIFLLRKNVCWAEYYKVNRAFFSCVGKVLLPSFGNLSLTGSVALFLQGSITLIGANFGTQVAAAFGVARTVSRLPFQFTYVYTRALFPTMTRSLNDTSALKAIVRRLFLIYVIIYLPMIFGFVFLGESLFANWLGDSLELDFEMIVLLGLWGAFHSAWHMLIAPLHAANNHSLLSFGYLLIVSVTLYFSASFDSVFLAILCFVLCDFLFCLIVLMVSLRFVYPSGARGGI